MKFESKKLAKAYLVFAFAVCLGVSLGAMKSTKYFPLKADPQIVIPWVDITVFPAPGAPVGETPAASPAVTPSSGTPVPSPVVMPVSDKIADWKTYTDREYGFDLKYPADIIKISRRDGYINLVHSIPFEHENSCDFKGDAPALKDLTDFNADIEVKNLGLLDAVRAEEGDLAEDYIVGNSLETADGYIEKVKIARLDGYLINHGFEWCGNIDYYFPAGSGKTLYVRRYDVAELALDPERYADVKGVVMPEKADVMFATILSTFEFLK